jgi:hypothetical protein
MCLSKISVALTVVLEGKFESEGPECTPNYFKGPKQNLMFSVWSVLFGPKRDEETSE